MFARPRQKIVWVGALRAALPALLLHIQIARLGVSTTDLTDHVVPPLWFSGHFSMIFCMIRLTVQQQLCVDGLDVSTATKL